MNFSKDDCFNCPLRIHCFTESDIKKGIKSRRLTLNPKHDAVVRDLKPATTEEFKEAFDNRYILERRFATMVKNHGLRRNSYLRVKVSKIHITLANIASNVVRMVKLSWNSGQSSFAIL